MIGVPTLISVALVWVPALSSVALSFTRWDGIGLDSIKWIGLRNYREIFTIYPPFYPALWHNLIWLLFFLLIPTPIGLFLAVLLDRELRFTRVYQSVIFLPVVLSLAIVGFIWQLMYSTDQGLINAVLDKFGVAPIDWLGNPSLNLWAVLIAASWRHVGYMMILYLAGLKSVDPALKEAAAIDGASDWQAFRYVVFPALRPINIVVLVITVIESLRAFDLVYVINGGRNGLELLSVLVTQNIIGEASRIGYGSAIATIMLVISTVFIVIYTLN
ncbi:MAG TPA: sugar ABC transporter permease, partial [Streptosporangiaceae bacterium]|nr:sugar ABC transporter permease [Streptosporangiaceae bacterium]